MKGDASLVSFVLIYAVAVLLIVAIAPFISEFQFDGEIGAEQSSEIQRFTSYSIIAALMDNSDTRKHLRGEGGTKPGVELPDGQGYHYFVSQDGRNVIDKGDSTPGMRYGTVYLASPSENLRTFSFGSDLEGFNQIVSSGSGTSSGGASGGVAYRQ